MLRTLTLACGLLATPAHADPSGLTIAQDRHEAGAVVRFDGAVDDRPVHGGHRGFRDRARRRVGHLAGRRVSVASPVAGDLFALGYSVEVPAAVGGDASVPGYELTLGRLPATCARRLRGDGRFGRGVCAGDRRRHHPVGAHHGRHGHSCRGYHFRASGKGHGKSDDLRRRPVRYRGARDGCPRNAGTIKAVERDVERDHPTMMPMRPSIRQIAKGFLVGVLISGLIAALVIAVAPKAVQSWRELALAQSRSGDLVRVSGHLGACRVRLRSDADDHRSFPSAGHADPNVVAILAATRLDPMCWASGYGWLREGSCLTGCGQVSAGLPWRVGRGSGLAGAGRRLVFRPWPDHAWYRHSRCLCVARWLALKARGRSTMKRPAAELVI